jgi:hypothetical protein
MEDLHEKSVTRSTRKFQIGAALWDGLVYPFRKTKLIRSIVFIFVYSIVMYYIAVLLVFSLMDMNSNILITQQFMSDEIYSSLISIFYYILFALFIGYLVAVIQESLKDNDKPPGFKNLKKLLVLGIKASIINIVINIIPEYLFKVESVVLFPIDLLNQFIPGINNIQHWVVLSGSNDITIQPGFIINQILLFLSVWIISPSIYVIFSRRGRLSDLLPLKQYIEIYKDKNYVRLVILTFLIFRVPTILIDYYAQTLSDNGQIFYYFACMPILSSSFYIYLSIVMNRILGKQWKTITQCHGDRKLLCDTTVQRKLDWYFK